MKIKWNKLLSLIPSKVQLSAHDWAHIGFSSKPNNENNLHGCWWPEKKVIWVGLHQGDKEKVLTYLHELVHAFSDTHNIGLTEKQVEKIEKALYYVLKKGNVFSDDNIED